MIKVLYPGLYSSVQDKGRFGFRRFGVPLSGVMDTQAAARVNVLVGNTPEAAVLEFTYPGPVLYFVVPVVVAFSGANIKVLVNDAQIETNAAFRVEAGSTISFKQGDKGVWGYMGVRGGLNTRLVLGSRSFSQGISPNFRISKQEELPIGIEVGLAAPSLKDKNSSESLKSGKEIEVYKGPEFERLSSEQRTGLFDTYFRIAAQSNRMGYLLEHTGSFSAKEIITSPVQPGTVQLTPSGRLIVLMREAQTTGGYARILQLKDNAVGYLSQKRAGQVIRFKLLE